jgi:hypothetical protein
MVYSIPDINVYGRITFTPAMPSLYTRRRSYSVAVLPGAVPVSLTSGESSLMSLSMVAVGWGYGELGVCIRAGTPGRRKGYGAQELPVALAVFGV